MKTLAIVALLTLGCFLLGCGTTTTATTAAGGNWAVTFAPGDPPAYVTLFNFETTFSVSGSGALSVTFVNFLTSSPNSCFSATGEGDTVGGSFDVTSLPSDPTATANVTFTVQGGGNSLALTGQAVGVTNTVAQTTTWNAVTGTWTLSGTSACTLGVTTPKGTFTMCPNSTTCSTT